MDQLQREGSVRNVELVEVAEDITEFRRAQRSLDEAEARLGQLAGQARALRPGLRTIVGAGYGNEVPGRWVPWHRGSTGSSRRP